MRIFFNQEPEDDVISILTFIEGFASEFCEEPIVIDSIKIEAIVQGMRNDFPHTDGMDNASVFKKAAHFITWFVAERPIMESFKNPALPSNILKINNYENSVVALLIGFAAIHGAEIHQNEKVIQLTNPIELSEHSFTDLVDAASSISPSIHFKLLAMLLEQLAYKTNPQCQYDVKPFS